MLVAQGQRQHVSVHSLLEEGCWEPLAPTTEIRITNCSFALQLACSPDFQDRLMCKQCKVCPWHSIIPPSSFRLVTVSWQQWRDRHTVISQKVDVEKAWKWGYIPLGSVQHNRPFAILSKFFTKMTHFLFLSLFCHHPCALIGLCTSALMLASFPGLPRFFCSSVFVQYNTRKRKSAKNGEGLGTPIMWMTSGGREVDVWGRCPPTNLCAINDRASFLPVKSSTVDLVNLRSLGYC